MTNKFNISRYCDLLQKNYVIEDKNAFENPEYLELLEYKASVYKEIYFSRKSEYCYLITQYLNTTLLSHQFIFEFLEMVKEDNEKSEKILQDLNQLANFSIHANIDNFSSLFRQIHNLCRQAFEFGHENDGYGIPEDEFRKSVEEIYVELENYLNDKR